MGGRDGSRGYLIQALIGLLGSLEDDTWSEVSIEPTDESEKVDIKWIGIGKPRRCQVKSSQNTITKSMVIRWIAELPSDRDECSCELILVGPASQGVVSLDRYDNVLVPPPRNNDISDLTATAAHKLDHFLSNNGLGQRSAKERELLVDAITMRLLEIGTGGLQLSKQDFISEIQKWIGTFRALESDESEFSARNALFYHRMPRNPYFSAREEILTEIKATLDDSNRAHLLVGLGGQGKTQIAAEFAYRNENDYTAVIWTNADSETSFKADLELWARARKIVGEMESLQETVRKALMWLSQNGGWLLVLDNLESTQYIGNSILQQRHAHLIITSRHADLQSLRARTIDVNHFSNAESLSFFRYRTGREQLVDTELSAASKLANELDGLPLALEQACAYMVSMQSTFSTYLNAFKSKRLKILERAKPITGAYSATVATTWQLNIKAVKRESRASYFLFRFCAFLAPDNIPFELIVSGADQMGRAIQKALADFFPTCDETLIDELLAPLTKLSLIRKNSAQRTFSIHRLVQEVTRCEMDIRAERLYRSKSLRTMSYVFPIVKPESHRYCMRLLSHAVNLLAISSDSDLMNEHGGTLFHRVANTLEENGDYLLAISAYQHAYNVRLSVLGESNEELGTTVNNLALSLKKHGAVFKAEDVFRTALDIRERALGKLHPDVAQTMQNLGVTLIDLGRIKEAEQLLLESLAIYEQAGQEFEDGLANCLSNLASLRNHQDLYVDAEGFVRRALTIREKADGHDIDPKLAKLYQRLAILAADKGSVNEALEYCVKSEAIIGRLRGPWHPEFVDSLQTRGAVLLKAKRRNEAFQVFSECVEIVEQLLGRSHPAYGEALVNKASCIIDRSDSGRSQIVSLLTEATSIFRSTLGENSLATSSAMNNLAYCHMRYREYRIAIQLYNSVLKIRISALGRFHNDTAIAHGNLAFCYFNLSQWEPSKYHFENAFRIYSRLGFPQNPDCKRAIEIMAGCYMCFGDAMGVLFLNRLRLKFAKELPNGLPEE